jgi:hypothetical protein
MKRRIEINIETRRVWVVGSARQRTCCFCEDCNEQVQMLSADEAAIIACVSPRIIYRWIEAGEIHFAETSGGLLICANSLSRAAEDSLSQRLRVAKL